MNVVETSRPKPGLVLSTSNGVSITTTKLPTSVLENLVAATNSSAWLNDMRG